MTKEKLPANHRGSPKAGKDFQRNELHEAKTNVVLSPSEFEDCVCFILSSFSTAFEKLLQ